MSTILELRDITKSYFRRPIFEHFDLEVPAGSIFGLLGPNGSGKTTLIRLITQIILPDAGDILLDGKMLGNQSNTPIGYMPEERGLYKKMPVGEQLQYLAQLKGLSTAQAKAKTTEWLERFQISSWRTKKVDELSKGMQQKVQFIATVMHEPRLLILDEPLTGLDPINSNLINQEIVRLRDQGTTIMFSTHRLEQVEEICDHVVLINQGQKLLNGTMAAIKQKFKQNIFEIKFIGNLPTVIDPSLQILEQTSTRLKLKLQAELEPNYVLQRLLCHEIEITSYREVLPTLNEIFVQQVKQQVLTPISS